MRIFYKFLISIEKIFIRFFAKQLIKYTSKVFIEKSITSIEDAPFNEKIERYERISQYCEWKYNHHLHKLKDLCKDYDEWVSKDNYIY